MGGFERSGSKLALAVVLGVVLVGGFLVPRLGGAGDFEGVMLQACEAAIQDRLAAPTSYKRLAVSGPMVRPATFEETLGLQFPERLRDHLGFQGDPKIRKLTQRMRASFDARTLPVIYEITLRYDGEPHVLDRRKGVAVCTYDSYQGKPLPRDAAALAEQVRLDGFTRIEWLGNRIGRARRLLKPAD